MDDSGQLYDIWSLDSRTNTKIIQDYTKKEKAMTDKAFIWKQMSELFNNIHRNHDVKCNLFALERAEVFIVHAGSDIWVR